MKNKGFTMIELLATITILGLIMALAVPNVMSTIDKNKRRAYVEDGRKMITLAEYRLNSDTSIEKPKNGQCVIFLLRSMDLTEFSEGPEGGSYNIDSSYAVIANSNNTYKYYVKLVEEYNEKFKGLDNVDRESLLKEGSIKEVKEFTGLGTVPAAGGSLNGFTVTRVVNTN